MNLLTEHTFGGLVKDAFAVYFQNFIPIFVIYLLPLFPVSAWQQYALSVKDQDQILLSSFLLLLVQSFFFLPITVAVSDICLGNKLSVRRAYAMISGGLLRRYLWTFVVLALVTALGSALLIVPALIFSAPPIVIFCLGVVPLLIFSALYMFAFLVALLEGSSGWAALARSKELGQGFYMRNSMAFILGLVAVMLLSGTIGGFSAVLLHQITPEPSVQILVLTFFGALFGPIGLILVIVIYYDMRVRKEAYDSTMLTQDLMR